jgi:hypothetical protein
VRGLLAAGHGVVATHACAGIRCGITAHGRTTGMICLRGRQYILAGAGRPATLGSSNACRSTIYTPANAPVVPVRSLEFWWYDADCDHCLKLSAEQRVSHDYRNTVITRHVGDERRHASRCANQLDLCLRRKTDELRVI